MNKKPLFKNRLKRQRKQHMIERYEKLHKLALLHGWLAPPISSKPLAKYWHYWCAQNKARLSPQ